MSQQRRLHGGNGDESKKLCETKEQCEHQNRSPKGKPRNISALHLISVIINIHDALFSSSSPCKCYYCFLRGRFCAAGSGR